ncbi:DNA repair protein [Algoriphagus lacus]|uniref:DNA repair protein n=1 Tax=Algoriphagus lacus TaxID=2056311 RepID=A0A418PMW9_9BACT|nr:JAB domain-containing protein [Algoriphagus lacus]RIW12983.1 DNA repair protein [Algoriphagus lacus]
MEIQERSLNEMEVAEVKISYQPKVKACNRPKVGSSKDAFHLLARLWDVETLEFVESFKIILLNRANRVLGVSQIGVGGTSAVIVDPKLVFVTALKANAHSMILAHNHPSGELIPSEPDRKITRKLVEIGRILDIAILDHLIVTPDSYFSFADEGEL